MEKPLNPTEFKEYKELMAKMKAKKLTEDDKARLAELETKRRQHSSSDNDIDWYDAGDKELLREVAGLSFGSYPGQSFYLGAGKTPTFFSHLMTVEFVPVPGITLGPTDPVNVAGRSNYIYVRSKNAGAKNYEHSDLTIYNLGWIYAAMGLVEAKRAIGFAGYYAMRNKLVPHELFQNGFRFNYEDIANNFNAYKARINLLIRKLNTITVPAGQRLLYRWMFLISTVFTDSELGDPKSAMICFTPRFHFKYEPTTFNTGGCLMAYDIFYDRGVRNLGDFLNDTEACIDALVSDDDAATMSGDQLKAYEGKTIALNEIEENFELRPIYSEDVLLQIHNASIFNVETDEWHFENPEDASTEDGIAILQKDGHLVFDPFFDVGGTHVNKIFGNRLLDTWKEKPTPEDVMEMTRFNYVIDPNILLGDPDGTDGSYRLRSCGSELITTVTVYKGYGVLSDHLLITQLRSMSQNLTSMALYLSPIDWHMPIYRGSGSIIIDTIGSGNIPYTVYDELQPVVDVQNYTSIADVTLEKLNSLALYSEFMIR